MKITGLGEMMPLQLWETTLDPERRLLKQLVVEDAAEANIVFSSLMGARVSRSILFVTLQFVIFYVASTSIMFHNIADFVVFFYFYFLFYELIHDNIDSVY